MFFENKTILMFEPQMGFLLDKIYQQKWVSLSFL